MALYKLDEYNPDYTNEIFYGNDNNKQPQKNTANIPALPQGWDDLKWLANQPCIATFKSYKYTHLIEIFGDRQYEPLNSDSSSISLEAYGYRWFRVNQMR
ncbi:hypothetical protein ACE1AT_02200 [Pelatocladus sp. BLCC-F211]|uniref:hypothetical protein n=1 Tax=Pelatocladus sp. BLCC-F211 TaxID=3342752 RepID=UPI0035B81A57